VVLGVGGGIAAYKACELVRRLRADGCDVTVVPTESALKFVGAATWEALSGHPVATDVFTDIPSVAHVATGQRADLVVIAPATADVLSRAASGRADDLLTATLLVTRAPVLMAPAMHTEMWTHPATVANVATLRARGVSVVDPAVGRLTGADSGAGRLPDAEHLEALAELLLRRPDALPRDLAGRRLHRQLRLLPPPGADRGRTQPHPAPICTPSYRSPCPAQTTAPSASNPPASSFKARYLGVHCGTLAQPIVLAFEVTLSV
jgi:phosphopantothenoylcysteine decarboxylase/phosphopantothenate--cysteine ligase